MLLHIPEIGYRNMWFSVQACMGTWGLSQRQAGEWKTHKNQHWYSLQTWHTAVDLGFTGMVLIFQDTLARQNGRTDFRSARRWHRVRREGRWLSRSYKDTTLRLYRRDLLKRWTGHLEWEEKIENKEKSRTTSLDQTAACVTVCFRVYNRVILPVWRNASGTYDHRMEKGRNACDQVRRWKSPCPKHNTSK